MFDYSKDVVGDVFEEVKENVYGGEGDSGIQPYGVSSDLGNTGKYCTLTKECMPSCNG